MRKAGAEPPIKTNPRRAACFFRKFQTFSVAGGSTRESFRNVTQNSLDGCGGAAGFRGVFLFQNLPFRAQASEAKFRRRVQQAIKAGPQQGCAQENGVVGVRRGPDQSRVAAPEARVAGSVSAHDAKVPWFAGSGKSWMSPEGQAGDVGAVHGIGEGEKAPFGS